MEFIVPKAFIDYFASEASIVNSEDSRANIVGLAIGCKVGNTLEVNKLIFPEAPNPLEHKGKTCTL